MTNATMTKKEIIQAVADEFFAGDFDACYRDAALFGNRSHKVTFIKLAVAIRELDDIEEAIALEAQNAAINPPIEAVLNSTITVSNQAADQVTQSTPLADVINSLQRIYKSVVRAVLNGMQPRKYARKAAKFIAEIARIDALSVVRDV